MSARQETARPAIDSPPYARGFFDLQLRFAERAAVRSGLPLSRALLEYTNLYVRFGLGRDFDPAHPGWRDYEAGLAVARGRLDYTYAFYRARCGAVTGPSVAASFGCFSYAIVDDGRLRLHFRNAGTAGCSPLARERQAQRMAELACLFRHVARTHRESTTVVGASWLYNVEAYRRLFPPSYLERARVLAARFRHMPLWGQFVDRSGEVREPVARAFLERLARLSTVERLDECFPLPVLAPEAPVQEFSEFYDLTPRAAGCSAR